MGGDFDKAKITGKDPQPAPSVPSASPTIIAKELPFSALSFSTVVSSPDIYKLLRSRPPSVGIICLPHFAPSLFVIRTTGFTTAVEQLGLHFVAFRSSIRALFKDLGLWERHQTESQAFQTARRYEGEFERWS